MNVTKNKIKQLQTGRKIHDGRGLYFFKKSTKVDGAFATNAMVDVMRWDVPYPEISISMARERPESYKKMLSCGLNPITEKRILQGHI